MKYVIPLLCLILIILLAACRGESSNETIQDNLATSEAINSEIEITKPVGELAANGFVSLQRGTWFSNIETDKARYAPGETVTFTLKLHQEVGDGQQLRYRVKHLDTIHFEQPINLDVVHGAEASWEWEAPAKDYIGYLVEVSLLSDDEWLDHINIAVDVSSDWGKFPRYGYLSSYHAMMPSSMEAIISRLNRFHINGIQFYDWQYKHHMPIKFEGDQPTGEWPDIANRSIALETVTSYIQLAHNRNMKAMNYNLLFGAYAHAEIDGVLPEWGLFKDRQRGQQDKHPLPSSWASDIYLYDPSNHEWRDYIINAEKSVFDTLPFDGWHVDQLGDRGNLFNYEGERVSLTDSYLPFIEQAEQQLQVDIVMNAVDQFGQVDIAKGPVKFLYTEVWSYPGYVSLKQVIDQNSKLSNHTLNTVLAAYINYELSNTPGQFNTPGVLFANAVTFASGGTLIALGENMLSKEYFPHQNLTLSPELEHKLINYYDFMVAYQNLLRDGAQETKLNMKADGEHKISTLPIIGSIWAFSKHKNERDIIQLINFTQAEHLRWNDTDGDQSEPPILKDVTLSVDIDRTIENVWYASPDAYYGSPIALHFTQEEGVVTFTLPRLEYWDMVVLE